MASASRLLVTLYVTPVTTLVSVGVTMSTLVYPVLLMRPTRSGLDGARVILLLPCRVVNTDACARARASESNANGAMNLRVVVATVM